MGLHSSEVEHCSATAEATGSNPIEAPKKNFSGYFAQIAIHCDGHIFISFVFPQFTSFHSVLGLLKLLTYFSCLL